MGNAEEWGGFEGGISSVRRGKRQTRKHPAVRRRRRSGQCPPLPVNLSRRPDLADLHVPSPNPEIYDDLTRDDSDR